MLLTIAFVVSLCPGKQVLMSKDNSVVFKRKGVVKERKPKDIIQKVANVRDGFNEACEWINNTGQGLDSDEACFKGAVIGRFKHCH